MNKRAQMLATLVIVCAAGLIGAAAQPAAVDQEPNANATSYATAADPMILELDARLAPQGLMVAHLVIPARPGPFTLVYPKWIPGEHGPTGPLGDLADLRISADGNALTWSRDPVDMYAFHVDVPVGVSHLNVTFNVIENGPEVMATRNISVVNWNRTLLYQNDTNSHDVYVKPSIILPAGWDYGTALPDARRTADRVDFGTVTLAMLVDSPLDCGRYYRHVPLWASGSSYAQLDMFADRPQDLDAPADILAAYKRVVPQALAMYGARHWYNYHFLLTLSDAIGFEGIEHHQSSDNRGPHDFMTNPQWQLASGDLLTHEFSHSWNGKYRRPYDLTTPNFQIPMQTDLLWVYEGLNEYLGQLISFRAGIRDPKLFPEQVAEAYAYLDNEPGRAYEPLIDTATGAPFLYQARSNYPSLRRTAGDFYTEGELIWLDADTIIRAQTGGRKSLDDFLRAYAGPPNTGPVTVTYTRQDIEHVLASVVPYDWHDFFQRRVYEIALHPPTDELARAGWRLVYTSTPNKFEENPVEKEINAWYSLGLSLSMNGEIRDVRYGSPAWRAGLSPGMKVVAVNGEAFDNDVLTYALTRAQHTTAPIDLLTSQNDHYQTFAVNYHGGPRYPHLMRIPGRADMLAKIAAPLAP